MRMRRAREKGGWAALLISALLALGTPAELVVEVFAAPACMQCHPRHGCESAEYGFHECTSVWRDGQLISCTLSGGECGSPQE